MAPKKKAAEGTTVEVVNAQNEKVEDRERALDAYSWMVLAWDEADAEVQPLYRQARADLARVQGLRRE